jgi:hypothetical protein
MYIYIFLSQLLLFFCTFNRNSRLTHLGWYRVIKGYLHTKSAETKASFSATKDSTQRYNTGERWTRHLITFFWTQSHTLWKDRCTSANALAADSLDKSSARTRQTEQKHMTMAYASNPLMLAIDRRIVDIPLEERLQARTSDLVAWTKTLLPTIRLSITEAAQNQLHTGHQDIRTYFYDTAEPERNKNATLATATTMIATTTTDRIGPRRTDFNRRET